MRVVRGQELLRNLQGQIPNILGKVQGLFRKIGVRGVQVVRDQGLGVRGVQVVRDQGLGVREKGFFPSPWLLAPNY
ncbi:MAG: hypothetical protein QMC80_07305 [Thermoplasmatales archaeon]|nr:hypothetical protein [Thermoplasmatales archaeon]